MNALAAQHPRTEAFFLELQGRRLFALQLMPTGPVRGTLLYLPPFGEEMNRCRSHVAATARGLAAQGWRCLLLDPSGTGESEGEIVDGDWGRWVDEAAGALQWLQHSGAGPVTLWGLRTGALLAAEVAARQPALVQRLLLWQPVVDGGLFVTQHLRLRLASQVVHAGDKESTESLRQRLSAGEAIEVAGYPFTGRLADALAARKLAGVPALGTLPVAWIEVVSKPEQPVTPASRRSIDAHVAAGGRVAVKTVVCPMIWQVHGREEAPALREATLHVMAEEVPA
jgi:exosortase A-associated hydrolase 2